MDGLYKMVQIRGGFPALNDGLKDKVWRADVTGCIGSLSKPRFSITGEETLSSFFLSHKRPIPTLCNGLSSIMQLFAFDGVLVSILGELQYLTSILNNATMDLLTIEQIVGSIQYHLLLYHSAGYKSSQNAVLQELCCIGALVYLKTLYHFHRYLQAKEIPAGALSDRAMIQKLKSCLSMAEANTAQARALFLWILFLGGAAVDGTKDRAWFVARLATTVIELQICRWEDAKSSLMTFLWVDRIHESSCRGLWDETQL